MSDKKNEVENIKGGYQPLREGYQPSKKGYQPTEGNLNPSNPPTGNTQGSEASQDGTD